MWFKNLVGFDEVSHTDVRANLIIEGDNIISKVNGKSFQYGTLEIPTLKDLKNKTRKVSSNRKITIKELIGNVQKLHCDPKNKHALFQAASQFNLLEMVSPQIIPEHGVDIYERDFTQGPACAIACGAGTIYRNYFATINNQIGQSSSHQIDCLELIGKELGNENCTLWEMKNGYALLNEEGITSINSQIEQLNSEEREQLKEYLKIGIQWNTEVTISDPTQSVSQAYCSAIPVSYSPVEASYCEGFARLVLEGAYEATIHAALLNYQKTGSNKVFLTLLGGGAFGNKLDWITESIFVAVSKFINTPLDIVIVSYNASKKEVIELIEKINRLKYLPTKNKWLHPKDNFGKLKRGTQ